MGGLLGAVLWVFASFGRLVIAIFVGWKAASSDKASSARAVVGGGVIGALAAGAVAMLPHFPQPFVPILLLGAALGAFAGWGLVALDEAIRE